MFKMNYYEFLKKNLLPQMKKSVNVEKVIYYSLLSF